MAWPFPKVLSLTLDLLKGESYIKSLLRTGIFLFHLFYKFGMNDRKSNSLGRVYPYTLIRLYTPSPWRRLRVKLFVINCFLSIYREVKKIGHVGSEWDSADSGRTVRGTLLTNTIGVKTDTEISEESSCIAKPESKFSSYWNLLLSAILLYTATVMPFTTVFLETGNLDKWFVIELIIDSVFFIDLILNLNTGYITPSGDFISSRQKIIMKYAKSWLIVDIISCIPFGYIDIGSNSSSINYSSLTKLLRLPKFYKLLRLARVAKMFKHYKNTSFFETFKDFFRMKQSAMRLLTSITSIVMCVHIASCFWCYISIIQGNGYNTWIYQSGLLDQDIGSLYITGIYWAVTTLCTVGYGDIHAYNNLEEIFSIFWMFTGVYFISFVIGSLSNLYYKIDTKDKILVTKLAIIDEFTNEIKLEKGTRQRIRHALRYSTDKNNSSWSHKQNIFNELPKDLRYQISLAMHNGAAKRIKLFLHKDPVIIAAIVPFLLPLFINDQELIYVKGEYAEEIYFVSKGKISYVNSNLAILSSCNQGEYFGDIEVVKEIERIYTTRAENKSDLLVMNKFLINTIQKDYPEVWTQFTSNAFDKEMLNEKSMVEALELIRMRDGSITFEEYSKGLEQRKRNNRVLEKIKLINILGKREKKKITVESLQSELEIVKYNLETLREEISEFKHRSSIGQGFQYP